MLASCYSCSHFTTGKHKTRPRIAVAASLSFLVSQSVNLVPSTQTVLNVARATKPPNHQHISLWRLCKQTVTGTDSHRSDKEVLSACMHNEIPLYGINAAQKSEVTFIIRACRYLKPSLNGDQRRGSRRNFTSISWRVMAAIWRSKMVQISENAPFPSAFSSPPQKIKNKKGGKKVVGLPPTLLVYFDVLWAIYRQTRIIKGEEAA